jgi:hypothetical protein
MPGVFAICRLDADATIPSWATKGSFFSLTKTDEELSIVCEEVNIPPSVRCEKSRLMFKIEGPIDFSLTGILASIANPLAQAKVSIFAISTFDTDYVMVATHDLEKASECLRNAGFEIH